MKTFKNVLSERLSNKAKIHNVDPNELCWYMKPLSNKHFDYYNKRYGTSFSLNGLKHSNDERTNFYFMRFVSSLFNKGRNYYINTPKKEKELAEALHYFDYKRVINAYKTPTDFVNYVLLNPDWEMTTTRIGKTKKNYLEDLSISIFQITDIITTFKIPKYKPAYEYPSFDEYFQVVSSFISNEKASYIDGMGLTLLADAVKECGLVDSFKPDVHILGTIKKLFTIPNLKKVNDESFRIMSKLFYDLSKKHQMSIYEIDKYIYMISAKEDNGFYIHSDSASCRDSLILDLKMIDIL